MSLLRERGEMVELKLQWMMHWLKRCFSRVINKMDATPTITMMMSIQIEVT